MELNESFEQLGFNSDIVVQGRTFHVQTEVFADPYPPTIHTAIYHRGCLIRKITCDCSSFLDVQDPVEPLREKVHQQHLTAVAGLQNGTISVE